MTRSMNASKALPLAVRRYRAPLDRPERVKRRLAGGIRPPRFDDAEQVFNPIDLVRAEEGVALPYRRTGRHDEDSGSISNPWFGTRTPSRSRGGANAL